MRTADVTIRVLIAADDTAVRRVVKIFLADADDMTIIGEANCGREAAEMIERLTGRATVG